MYIWTKYKYSISSLDFLAPPVNSRRSTPPTRVSRATLARLQHAPECYACSIVTFFFFLSFLSHLRLSDATINRVGRSRVKELAEVRIDFLRNQRVEKVWEADSKVWLTALLLDPWENCWKPKEIRARNFLQFKFPFLFFRLCIDNFALENEIINLIPLPTDNPINWLVASWTSNDLSLPVHGSSARSTRIRFVDCTNWLDLPDVRDFIY